jgi:sugar lactone lactonase YvrE
MKYDAAGKLIVADGLKGVLSVSSAGEVTVLTAAYDGKPLRAVDDLAIASDGVIYFSDVSDRWPIAQFMMDVIEHRPAGRLFAYHPTTGKTQLVHAGFYFANGVAVGPDDAYVLVAETSSYRVRRVWLRGDKAGTSEVFIDNLPGFPDNITWSPERHAFWLAINSPRVPALDAASPRPWLRKVMLRLPKAIQPAPERHSWALAIDEKGEIVADLQDEGATSYTPITSVLEHGGWLYIGSNQRDGVLRMKAP